MNANAFYQMAKYHQSDARQQIAREQMIRAARPERQRGPSLFARLGDAIRALPRREAAPAAARRVNPTPQAPKVVGASC